MPFYLKESDVLPRVAGFSSVLIVPCRFCPAASMAVREKKPYIQLFRHFLKTESYESYIRDLRRRLQEEGVETAVFASPLPHNFLPCMWTAGRRRKLAQRAAEFDAVVVLGCDAAGEVVREAIGSTNGRVIQGMEAEGIMWVVPTLRFPFNISLRAQGLTPVEMREPRAFVD
jgi:hypothetical protein